MCYLSITWEIPWATEQAILTTKLPGMDFYFGTVSSVAEIIQYYCKKIKAVTRIIQSEPNTYREQTLLETHHQALMYSLLSYIAYKNDALAGYSIGHCQQCGAEFVKKHGNAKYCKQCSTGAARQKAFRDRHRKQELYES